MARFLLDQGELKITLQIESETALGLLSRAFTDLSLKPVVDASDIVLTVKDAEQGTASWALHDSTEGHTRGISESGDLVYHVSDRIIFHIADKTQTGHCLHAAAVQLKDKACVIPAQSGAGKSSLTAWLVANNFSYITDELIVVDHAGKMTGVARPIQIKSPGLPVIKPLLQAGVEVFSGDLANAISAASLGGRVASSEPREIALFLFPKYDPSADFDLRPLSSAEAGLQLMSNHVNARNLQDHGFRAMMKMIRATPCFNLNYGGFDKLPSDFSAQLLAMGA